MILPNSRSTKICVNESDYLALVDAATDILDALRDSFDFDDGYPARLPSWDEATELQEEIDNLKAALQALGEL